MGVMEHSCFTVERWRCPNGHEQAAWRIGCVKCYEDLERFEVEVVPASQFAGAVEERDRLLAVVQDVAANEPRDMETLPELARWALDHYRAGGQS